MNVALQWARQNVVIIVLVVVMLAAVVALPIVAGKIDAGVQAKMEKRGSLISELSGLQRTQIVDPQTNAPLTAVINQPLLEQYRVAVEAQQKDADAIRARSLEHNRAGHELTIPAQYEGQPFLFPAPPAGQHQVYPSKFHAGLVAAYEALLDEIDAGMPPALADMREDLVRREAQYRAQQFRKNPDEELTEEESAALRKELGDFRLSRYAERAEEIRIYASIHTLGAPVWDDSLTSQLGTLFSWQWDFWIKQDLLRAINAANEGSTNVLQSPVKRLMSLQVDSVGTGGSTADGGGGAAGGGGISAMGGGGGGMQKTAPGGGMTAPGMGGGGPVSGDGSGAGAQGPPLDPKAPVPTNYHSTFTGRMTNPLYDVRYAQLEIVVSAVELPRVLDALAVQNFMTVTNLEISPVDVFAEAQQGFLYGTGEIVRANMTIETVWLREWTRDFMPAEMKAQLGVAMPPPAPPGEAM